MTTEANDQPEPVIWFEGTLIRDPQPHGGQDDWLLETLADADGDEGSGIDIEATSLAFDPSHDEPDGEQ